MLFTLEKVNQVVLASTGLRLGGVILDDCDRDTYGLQQATEFIQGQLKELNWRNVHRQIRVAVNMHFYLCSDDGLKMEVMVMVMVMGSQE